ncbi:hypothetical protein CYMTET_11057 [Cymbomonas tetramitiformis]|uniref:Uncharacterized protein n=1 Tax=Cymbomonas tetramitiformis TaxID=36881 RepID=A0AAE0LDU8_9CHLO|nr:hypothetical protein CYMTET_11057 [Cymbomonas tetramitiformis]
MNAVNDDVRKEFSSGIHMTAARLQCVKHSGRTAVHGEHQGEGACRHTSSPHGGAQENGGYPGEGTDKHISGPDVREHKLSDRARAMRYVGHSEVSSAYLLFDPMAEKDPSVMAPLESNFMLTSLDSEYRERPTVSDDAVVVQHDVYILDGSDEIIAVVKLRTAAADCFWTSLRWFLEGAPENQAKLASYEGLAMGVNAGYPMFSEVRVDTGLGDL